MKKIKIKIPGWVIVIAVIILAAGLTSTFVGASGRFNLPLSWILTPSGTSVDTDNNGVIDSVNGGVPAGAIMMWAGSLATIPTGWALSDGTNGTPDLRAKFIIGVTTSTDPGSTGGTSTYSLTANQLPAHSHTGTTESAGSHGHSYLDTETSNYSGQADEWGIAIRELYRNPSTVNSNTSGAGGLAHSFTTNQSGNGATIDNRPAFYELAYIIKL